MAAAIFLCPKLVNSSSSALHVYISGLLGAGARWWAARVIGTQRSVLVYNGVSDWRLEVYSVPEPSICWSLDWPNVSSDSPVGPDLSCHHSN